MSVYWACLLYAQHPGLMPAACGAKTCAYIKQEYDDRAYTERLWLQLELWQHITSEH